MADNAADPPPVIEAETLSKVEVPQLSQALATIPVRGTSPLIVHRFAEKAKAQMLANMQGRKAQQKETKDPEAEYRDSLYRFADGRYGFPVVAFKAATIGAARFYPNVKMTELRMFMYFDDELGVDNQKLAIIEGDEPKMREDYVRFGMSSTDLRYRGEFVNWYTTLYVRYVTSALSQDSVLALVEAGGLGGVGEWRPAGKKSSGENGTYELDPDRNPVFEPWFGGRR